MKRIALLPLLLASCAGWGLVKVERTTVRGSLSVHPQIEWNRSTSGPAEVWTVDGPWLESVRFYVGVKDGAALFSGKDMPVFRDHMQATGVQEFVVDSYGRSGGSEVQAGELKPAKFGGLAGFRFDFTYLNSDGLQYRGLAAGAVTGGLLHLVLYTGTREHYYPKYEKHVERILKSLRVS